MARVPVPEEVLVPTGLDVNATEELLKTLRAHEAAEDDLLDAYRSIAEGDPDDGVRYLARLIIEDEERHHELLEQMANQVETWISAERNHDGTPALSPRLDRALLDTTRQLIARERADAKELRQLRHELHDVPKASLLPLMVELMLHDTAKHIEILRFVRTYTG